MLSCWQEAEFGGHSRKRHNNEKKYYMIYVDSSHDLLDQIVLVYNGTSVASIFQTQAD